jgi:hypothetical protein
MQVAIEGNDLVVRLPLEEPTPSTSGKTLIVASSHGSHETTATFNGKPIIVGCNAYVYAKDKKPSANRVELVKAELAS